MVTNLSGSIMTFIGKTANTFYPLAMGTDAITTVVSSSLFTVSATSPIIVTYTGTIPRNIKMSWFLVHSNGAGNIQRACTMYKNNVSTTGYPIVFGLSNATQMVTFQASNYMGLANPSDTFSFFLNNVTTSLFDVTIRNIAVTFETFV
jgi:hypothetical protein